MIKSVAGQTIQSTQKYVLKTVLGHDTVSPQPPALEYSVKSYGERTEVAMELSFLWLFLITATTDQTPLSILVLSLTLKINQLCARDEARELIHKVRYCR